jgi:hypothetical protein
MPISSSTTRSSYNGDGVTAAFAVGFVYFDDDHVRVVHVSATGTETVWTRGSEYTLSGDGAAGTGQVDIDTSPTDYTPAVGEKLVVRLFPPLTQDVELPSGNYLDDIEEMGDIGLQQALRQQDEIDRSVKFAEGSSTTGKTMPEPSDGDVLGWSGGALVNLTPNSEAYLSVSTFGATLIDDADAAAARTTLGLGTAAVEAASAFEAADADILKADVTATLSAGFNSDVHAIGNSGTGTVTLTATTGEENLKTLTINGSFTLAPQATNTVVALIATNDGTGGYTITTSGYSLVSGTYNDTASAVHLMRSTVIGSVKVLEILEIA